MDTSKISLTVEELASFNKDLEALCEKHGVILNIGHQLVVDKKEVKSQ